MSSLSPSSATQDWDAESSGPATTLSSTVVDLGHGGNLGGQRRARVIEGPRRLGEPRLSRTLDAHIGESGFPQGVGDRLVSGQLLDKAEPYGGAVARIAADGERGHVRLLDCKRPHADYSRREIGGG